MNSQKATPMVPIDLDRIKMIESSGNPMAFNMRSGARGLYQITPVCLKDWNDLHPSDKHFPDALFKPEVNKKIASWYFMVRIPAILRSFNIPVTTENVLMAYCWGAGNLRKYLTNEIIELPEEVVSYVYRYKNNI